jgi:hypothetical protein
MTLAIAWVRKLAGGGEELIIVADSRLGGGRRLDCCPKIMTLPRSDSVICFAGETEFAYPLMLQLYLAIDAHSPSKDRSMDIHEMMKHALKVFNSMRDSVHSYVEGMEIPETSFILGGYSWARKGFSIWLIHYKTKEMKFVCRPALKWIGNFEKIVFAGDWAKEGQTKLIKMLIERYKLTSFGSESKGFDLEPFEVLRDILRESKPEDSVGGSPQMVKVYQHMNARPIAVYWPNKESQNVSLLGRPLLAYENTDYWILDPDTLKTSHPRFSKPTRIS